MTKQEWLAEGTRRFGPDQRDWRFVCPVCGYVVSVRDYEKAGAPIGAVAFSCLGRWLPKCAEAFSGKPGPCSYAGGGLFRINPQEVEDGGTTRKIFAFAEAEVPNGL